MKLHFVLSQNLQLSLNYYLKGVGCSGLEQVCTGLLNGDLGEVIPVVKELHCSQPRVCV